MQGWYFEQTTAARQPTYKLQRYVCWNAALFEPVSESTPGQVLALQYSYRSNSNYLNMFRIKPGLTILVVAKWGGKQGNADYQDMVTFGLDSYTSGYTIGYGWAAAIGESGVVGLKASSGFQYQYRYCYTYYYYWYAYCNNYGYNNY